MASDLFRRAGTLDVLCKRHAASDYELLGARHSLHWFADAATQIRSLVRAGWRRNDPTRSTDAVFFFEMNQDEVVV